MALTLGLSHAVSPSSRIRVTVGLYWYRHCVEPSGLAIFLLSTLTGFVAVLVFQENEVCQC